MSILNRVTTHFDSYTTKRIEVPEWKDEKGQATIIFAEPLTLADRKTLSKFAGDDDSEFIVRLIIMKATDSDGNKMFDLGDKPVLMRKADPVIIARIAAQIAEAPTVDEMAGN